MFQTVQIAGRGTTYHLGEFMGKILGRSKAQLFGDLRNGAGLFGQHLFCHMNALIGDGFFDAEGIGAIINSSRCITAAYKKDENFTDEQYAQAARAAALRMKEDLLRVL